MEKRLDRFRCTAIAMTIAVSTASVSAFADGDPARGLDVFRACAACHSLTPREHLTGPSLADVWQRKAASVAGFDRYSDALQKSGLTWNAETLDKWLANPEELVPGTSMTFPGLRERRSRDDVVAYLRSAAEGKAPIAAPRGNPMHGPPSKVDMKTAPPEGQVTAISLCRDTYTVKTADGGTNKVWEFNLRFKTDSSVLGPRPGKPVIVGAGMQGDRASIVFATPGEIGRFVKESCTPS